jgi:cytochrome oxidase Cu insertion factor (SCO1/SenC/PrrC family)
VALVCLAPVIASYLTFYFWQPSGRINYGQLLPADPLGDLSFVDLQRGRLQLGAVRGKWLLIHAAPARCDQLCERRLWISRQVRIAMGKHQERFERIWLITDHNEPPPALLREYAGAYFLRETEPNLAKKIATTSGNSGPIHLIDPWGNLMMRYPLDADPERILRDLKRLVTAQGN